MVFWKENTKSCKIRADKTHSVSQFYCWSFSQRYGPLHSSSWIQDLFWMRTGKGRGAWSAWNLHETNRADAIGRTMSVTLAAALSALVRRTNRMHGARSTCVDSKIHAKKSPPVHGTFFCKLFQHHSPMLRELIYATVPKHQEISIVFQQRYTYDAGARC